MAEHKRGRGGDGDGHTLKDRERDEVLFDHFPSFFVVIFVAVTCASGVERGRLLHSGGSDSFRVLTLWAAAATNAQIGFHQLSLFCAVIILIKGREIRLQYLLGLSISLARFHLHAAIYSFGSILHARCTSTKNTHNLISQRQWGETRAVFDIYTMDFFFDAEKFPLMRYLQYQR